MDQIRLQNMAFYGYHGNLSAEKELGQRFFVDVTVQLDLSKAGQSDAVDDTLNYAELYEVVKQVMEGQAYRLLERVGTVIAETVWSHFPSVIGVAVTIRKPSAPVPGVLDFAEVTIQRGQI